MHVIVQVAKKDRAKAWEILLEHSPGTALPDRTFIISLSAARALRKARVKFKEISRVADSALLTGVFSGERI
jgi:hypothetical protein